MDFQAYNIILGRHPCGFPEVSILPGSTSIDRIQDFIQECLILTTPWLLALLAPLWCSLSSAPPVPCPSVTPCLCHLPPKPPPALHHCTDVNSTRTHLVGGGVPSGFCLVVFLFLFTNHCFHVYPYSLVFTVPKLVFLVTDNIHLCFLVKP